MPKSLWHLVVQEASYTWNRCFNKHTSKTPYPVMTGRKCYLSKMHKFGSECYTYQKDRGKDLRSEKGFFVGHDKDSPAFHVYYPSKGKVQKHRQVKFVTKTTSEVETQTQELGLDLWGESNITALCTKHSPTDWQSSVTSGWWRDAS